MYASIERLLKDTPKEGISIPHSRQVKWNGRAALTKLNVLALLHRFPQDPESGEPFTLMHMGELLEEHRELKKVVLEVGPTNIPTLANRVLLARKESLAALENATDSVLRSHLIDEKTARDLRRQDFEAFAKKRAKRIDEWAQQFFVIQAGIGENDRPALAELTRRVENLALSA